MAAGACGLAGLLCVIVAGWTTANPTIYRAGLAFQAISPKTSRFKVTLLTGVAATIAGAFPAVTMNLLEFVPLYGLLLMPMGAVIFVDFWLLPRLGLRSNFAEHSGTDFNWAAGIAWLATLAICLALWWSDPEVYGFKPFQIYFVSLPGWFVAALLYLVSSSVSSAAGTGRGAFAGLCSCCPGCRSWRRCCRGTVSGGLAGPGAGQVVADGGDARLVPDGAAVDGPRRRVVA